MVKDFLSQPIVTIFFGKPLRFDDIKGHDEAARGTATQRIMSAITLSAARRYERNPEQADVRSGGCRNEAGKHAQA